MNLILIRTYHPYGTNGTLHLENKLLCYTIELPWLDNAPQCSCIPEGRYRLKMRFSKRYLTHMLVEKVPGRSLILIHPANDAKKELKGCIAPVTFITGIGKGLLSKMAFQKIKSLVLSRIDNEPVYLIIKKSEK